MTLAYPLQRPVPYTLFNNCMDGPIGMLRGAVSDLIVGENGTGGWLKVVPVAANSPADLTVIIPAGYHGCTAAGEMLHTVLAQVNCAVDYLGASCVPSSGNLWISIFSKFGWIESSLIAVDGYANPFPRLRTEGVVHQVHQGTANTPPSTPAGMIRTCNILMTEAITQITNADIHYAVALGEPFIAQDLIRSVAGDYVPKTGGSFTGAVRGEAKGLFMQQSGGTFTWNAPLETTPVGWPSWLVNQRLSAMKIKHGLGARFVHPIALPCITEADSETYAAVQALTYIEVTPNMNNGIFITNDHDGNNYTGKISISIIGSENYVTWFTRIAAGIQGRKWRWAVWA